MSNQPADAHNGSYESPYLSENWDLTVEALPDAYRQDTGIYWNELVKIESSYQGRGDVPHSLVVLEVGCGGGRAMNDLAKSARQAGKSYPRLDFIGVEPSQHMLDRAIHCPDIRHVGSSLWILGSSDDFFAKIESRSPGKKADLLFMALGSVHHLIEEGQIQTLLQNIAQILRPEMGRACLSFLNKILQRDGEEPTPDPQSELEVQSRQFPGLHYRTVFVGREEVNNVRENKYEIQVFEKGEAGQENLITTVPNSFRVRVWNDRVLKELFKAHGLVLVDEQRTEVETFYSLAVASR